MGELPQTATDFNCLAHSRFEFPEDNVYFNSCFDSGNMADVQRLETDYFQIWTAQDCKGTKSENGCRTWFYFKVKSEIRRVLKFTIKNLNNQSKLYGQGLKPVYRTGKQEWKRLESVIGYQLAQDNSGNFELTFNHLFEDTVTSFAFTYPWSYKQNQKFIDKIQEEMPERVYFCRETLIHSLERRKCELLTMSSYKDITDIPEPGINKLFMEGVQRPFQFQQSKRIILVTSRVHPGETAGSYVLNGFLKFLLSDDPRAIELLENFVFKIIPILNPDGVFRGHYRTDTQGVNLNRVYIQPSILQYPTIFAVREVFMQIHSSNRERLFAYIDLHAHASKRGVFVYGNTMEYIKQVDSCLLAKVLSLNCVNFDYYGSSFSEKNIRLSSNKDGGTKEGSGRVALFRASNNPRCYTLECNYHSGRIINDIARCQINETDQEIYNSYVYQHGPPPYDILLFEDVGKAMGVSFLDLIEKNMHSRLDSALQQIKIEVAQQIAQRPPFRFDPKIKKMSKNTEEIRKYLYGEPQKQQKPQAGKPKLPQKIQQRQIANNRQPKLYNSKNLVVFKHRNRSKQNPSYSTSASSRKDNSRLDDIKTVPIKQYTFPQIPKQEEIQFPDLPKKKITQLKYRKQSNQFIASKSRSIRKQTSQQMESSIQNTSKSDNEYATTDEQEYQDKLIPMKMHSHYIPSNLLFRICLDSWTGQQQELWDNAGELYDSMDQYDPNASEERPQSALNFKFERIKKNPHLMHQELLFGKGEAKFKNGMTYNGDTQFGHLHGRGTLQALDFTYTGTFRNSEMEGDGTYQWNGHIYTGEIKRGLRNGEGTLHFDNGNQYTGEWREGVREGYGKVQFASGTNYEGYWQNGKMEGHGILRYKSGNYYEGYFLNGKQHGQGIMIWLDRNEKYQGEWKDGKQHGYGIHVWMSSAANAQLRNRYVGQWAFGKRHGYGTFYYANGSKYEGNWVDNMKHGQGIMTFEDGSEYNGMFERDRMWNRMLSGDGLKDMTRNQARLRNTRISNNNASRTVDESRANYQPSIDTQDTQIRRDNKMPLVEEEENPFLKMIDIEDIAQQEGGDQNIVKEVQKILLHNTMLMKNLFNHYKNVERVQREEILSMTLSQFWRLLRDMQIISPMISIAQVDRLLIQGRRNQFKIIPNDVQDNIHTEQKDYTQEEDLQQLDISNISSKSDQESEDVNQFPDLELDDIHNPDKPIFLRHLIDGLIRVSYLKYGSGGKLKLPKRSKIIQNEEVYYQRPKSNVGIGYYKLINEKILPNFGQKQCKTDREVQSLEEAVACLKSYGEKEALVQSIIVEREAGLTVQGIFNQLRKKNRGNINGKRDNTVEIKTLLRFLNGIEITEFATVTEIIELIEKYYDDDENFARCGNGKLLMFLLNQEITEYEFFEFLALLALKLEQPRRIGRGYETITDRVTRFIEEKLIIGMTKIGKSQSIMLTSELTFQLKSQAPRRKLWIPTEKQNQYKARKFNKQKAKIEQEQRRMALEDICVTN